MFRYIYYNCVDIIFFTSKIACILHSYNLKFHTRNTIAGFERTLRHRRDVTAHARTLAAASRDAFHSICKCYCIIRFDKERDPSGTVRESRYESFGVLVASIGMRLEIRKQTRERRSNIPTSS